AASTTQTSSLIIVVFPTRVRSVFLYSAGAHRHLPSFPTRRSSDLLSHERLPRGGTPRGPPGRGLGRHHRHPRGRLALRPRGCRRSEEHTSELQSRVDLVCRLLLEKKNKRRCNEATHTQLQSVLVEH